MGGLIILEKGFGSAFHFVISSSTQFFLNISFIYHLFFPAAKDLIDNLLVVDQKKRFTAVEVLQHPWVKGGERNNSVTNLQREVSINLEKNFSRPSSSKR